MGNKPLTEILAMGIGVVMNYELRVEAHKKIMVLWPTSTPLLSMACCAFQVKGIDSVALTKPALIKDKEKLKSRFYIYMLDFETKKDLIIEAISICRNQGIMPQFIFPSNSDVFFTLPDLKNLGFEFYNLEANRIFKDIHYS